MMTFTPPWEKCLIEVRLTPERTYCWLFDHITLVIADFLMSRFVREDHTALLVLANDAQPVIFSVFIYRQHDHDCCFNSMVTSWDMTQCRVAWGDNNQQCLLHLSWINVFICCMYVGSQNFLLLLHIVMNMTCIMGEKNLGLEIMFALIWWRVFFLTGKTRSDENQS